MSLTSDELEKKINHFIEAVDNEGLVNLLEPLYKKGKLDDENTLLLGIVLMTWPVDEPAAIDILTSLYKSKFRYQAAIWHAYLYTTLYPVNDSFKIILEEYKNDAVACYMMAKHLSKKDKEHEALKWNERSIQIKEFPNNLEFKLRWDPSLSKKEIEALFKKIKKLVVDKKLESSPLSKNKEELHQFYWDQLIVGTRITSSVWKFTKEYFEKRMNPSKHFRWEEFGKYVTDGSNH